MNQELIEKAARAFFAAVRANDVEAFTAIFADDAVFEDPVGTPARRGKAEIGDFLTGILALTKEFGIIENHIFTGENTAAVKWSGKGVGKNDRPFEFEGIDVIEVNEDGKIQSFRAFWNIAPVMAILTA